MNWTAKWMYSDRRGVTFTFICDRRSSWQLGLLVNFNWPGLSLWLGPAYFAIGHLHLIK